MNHQLPRLWESKRGRLEWWTDCTVPVSTLYAVAKQPDEILVPNTTDCFDLHLEFLLSLAPGEAVRKWEILYQKEEWNRGEKWNGNIILEKCAVFKFVSQKSRRIEWTWAHRKRGHDYSNLKVLEPHKPTPFISKASREQQTCKTKICEQTQVNEEWISSIGNRTWIHIPIHKFAGTLLVWLPNVWTAHSGTQPHESGKENQ